MAEKGFFYTNGAAVGFSAFDFTLLFQRRSIGSGVSPTPGMQGTAIAGELDVVSSPGHTKMLAAALMDSVMKYESQYGIIKLSDADMTTFENVIAGITAPRSTKQ